MRKKVQTFLFLLILTTDVAFGKYNKLKSNKGNNKKNNTTKPENERIKRSLNDDEDRPFWPNRGKKQIDDDSNYNTKHNNEMEYSQKIAKSNEKLLKNQPFWGNRGRRSGSIENFLDYEYSEYIPKHCDHCVDFFPKTEDSKSNKDRRENFISPFWGSRGRRSSFELEDEPFWGNRGRRMEQEPFWGNRGRRTENEPFWGNRGKREDEPFWGNRGRRVDKEEPFWGNRGRRYDSEPFWGNRGRRQDAEPFWGNRGRRQENEPFWGNRGRREEEPFWGNRGRRKDAEQSGDRNRKEDLKDSILTAINDVENDIENLSRLKKTVEPDFWANRGRNNKLSLLFNGPSRTRTLLPTPRNAHGQTAEPGTVLDNRMYVDEPNYILVERTGRSSGEEDPYYISRGKKYYYNYNLEQAARDRRGAIEEIVKSVRNDPYYIARGKKDSGLKNANSTVLKEEYTKAKDLICAAIELIMVKNDNGKVKREISDNERDRRTTLKKLAAQLQADPYFVSRGKKSDGSNDKDYLQDFISNVAEKCN